MDLDSCTSGLAYPITSQETTLKSLYLGDQNCLGKLKDFSLLGKTYYPKEGFGFKTWSPGSVAVFTDGQKDFDMQVASQIPVAIEKSAEVSYKAYERILDPSTNDMGKFLFGKPTTVLPRSKPVPFSFLPKSIRIRELNFGAQSLSLEIDVECSSPLKTNDVCGTTSLGELSYALIENRYKGLPCQAGMPDACWKILKEQNNPPIITKPSGPEFNGGFSTEKIDTNHSPFSNPKYFFLVGNSSAVWVLPITFESRTQF
jgi:hypothetical protein